MHVPVMVNEVLEYLNVPVPGLVIDATVGGGGHSAAILGASPATVLIGMDRDPEAIEAASKRLHTWADRVELLCADYRQIPQLSFERRWWPVRGILVDLGISSLQLDSAERGFAFRKPGPLDMRFDRSSDWTAADLVNTTERDEMATILRRYGDERFAHRIARAIERARNKAPIRSTDKLAEIVAGAIPVSPRHIHPATRTFQAIRIAVNEELRGLYEFVVGSARLLAPYGRLVVLTYHSLEDRLVKQAFQYLSSDCVCPPRLPQCACSKVTEVEILAKPPALPRPEEVEANPRARSARLRALERW